ncbi:cellulose binding domain-containing protein [Glycomyces tenuis]|uniref:cellulose binding domain-containing protein n=2 Tax=Glycomyces tenuis TaxID=58116 RepID=UPI00047D8CC3|nr:cellulose binding domain-containing protein [Glycomyces tenuis]
MRAPSRILKAALAVGIGLLSALHAPASATADPLPADRRFFVAHDTGEDECTLFFTQGEVRWDLPARSTVTVSGSREFHPTDDSCIPHEVFDRQIEVTALGADGTALGAHTEPFGVGGPTAAYEFTITAGAAIETVTVAVCRERLPDGSTWPDRCGETRTLTGSEPPSPYCRYSVSYEQWHGGGFLTEIEVIPVEADSTGWRIEFELGEDTSVTAVWNGEWTRDGSSVTVTDAGWNGAIEVGDTALVGLIGRGEPVTHSTGLAVHVDGNRCWDEGIEV